MTVKEFIDMLIFDNKGFLEEDTELCIRKFDFLNGEYIYFPVNEIIFSKEPDFLAIDCSYGEEGLR